MWLEIIGIRFPWITKPPQIPIQSENFCRNWSITRMVKFPVGWSLSYHLVILVDSFFCFASAFFLSFSWLWGFQCHTCNGFHACSPYFPGLHQMNPCLQTLVILVYSSHHVICFNLLDMWSKCVHSESFTGLRSQDVSSKRDSLKSTSYVYHRAFVFWVSFRIFHSSFIFLSFRRHFLAVFPFLSGLRPFFRGRYSFITNWTSFTTPFQARASKRFKSFVNVCGKTGKKGREYVYDTGFRSMFIGYSWILYYYIVYIYILLYILYMYNYIW